jgi:hypothetical protein
MVFLISAHGADDGAADAFGTKAYTAPALPPRAGCVIVCPAVAGTVYTLSGAHTSPKLIAATSPTMATIRLTRIVKSTSIQARDKTNVVRTGQVMITLLLI